VNSSNSNSPVPIPARLTRAVTILAEIFQEKKIEYALIGGLGVAVRGNSRATEDADFLVEIPSIKLPTFLDRLVESGCTLNISSAIRDWSQGGVLVIHGPGMVPIDFLKPVLPVFHQILKRARDASFGEHSIKVADAEGLLLLKLIAFRPLDQEDIRGILAANQKRLDLEWVRSEFRNTGLPSKVLDEFENMVKDFYET